MFENVRLSKLSRYAAALLLAAGFVLILINLRTSGDVRHVHDSWREYRASQSEKPRLESVLRASLGYGGMVHHFKNYVLRREPERIDRTRASIGAARVVVSQYAALGTSVAEATALEGIGTVLDKYDAALSEAVRLVGEGRTPAEIDAAVRVDGGPALRALETLRREVERQLEIEHVPESKAWIAAALRAEIGYGGMIHAFKNYVLRHEPPLAARAREKLALARAAVGRYWERKPTAAEALALGDISDMLDAYEAALQTAERLAEEGLSPAEIDPRVKVDDTPALRGFAVLDREIAHQSHERSREVSLALSRADVLLDASIWGTLILVTTLMAGMIWGIQVVVIRPIGRTTEMMTRLAADQLDVDVPGAELASEIGEMARAVKVFKENAIRRRAAEEEIRQLTLIDPLTGAANRRRFDARLKEVAQLCKREGLHAALLVVDLDGFKAVNDTHGHHVGDEVLKVVADRMQHVTRDVDTVGRLGGDEFGVILLALDRPADAAIPARRLIEDIERPIEVEGIKICISASIGIRRLGPEDDDLQWVMRDADAAMYEVKRSGRGGFAFSGGWRRPEPDGPNLRPVPSSK